MPIYSQYIVEISSMYHIFKWTFKWSLFSLCGVAPLCFSKPGETTIYCEGLCQILLLTYGCSTKSLEAIADKTNLFLYVQFLHYVHWWLHHKTKQNMTWSRGEQLRGVHAQAFSFVYVDFISGISCLNDALVFLTHSGAKH